MNRCALALENLFFSVGVKSWIIKKLEYADSFAINFEWQKKEEQMDTVS